METKRHEKAWVFGNLCIDLWIVPSIGEIVMYHPARLFFMHYSNLTGWVSSDGDRDA